MTPPSTEDLLAHTEFLESVAHGLVRDPGTADDIMQEVWITALEHRPRHGDNLPSWLRTVARNVLYRSQRSQIRRGRRERSAARPEEQPSTSEVVAQEHLLALVAEGVGELEDPYKSVLLLRFYEDLPPREIAERLGRPVNTVNSQIQRGLEKLRKALDERTGNERENWCAGLVAAVFGRRERDAAPLTMLRSAGLEKLVLQAALVAASLVAFLGWRLARGDDPGIAPPTTPTLATATALPPSLPPSFPTAATTAERHAIAAAQPQATSPARLAVRVVDERGKAVHRATVFVTDFGPGAAQRPQGIRTERGQTDRRGSFALELGDFDVGYPRAFPRLTGRVGVRVVDTRRVASDAHYVEVHAGRELELQIELTKDPALALHGHVVDEDGRPVVGAKVNFWDYEVRPEMRADGTFVTRNEHTRVTDERGRFAFEHLAPRRHLLTVGAPGFVTERAWTGSRAGGTEKVTLVLRHGATVTGRVELPDGRPAANAAVSVLANRRGLGRMTRTAADGTYRLAGFAAGVRRVTAVHADGRFAAEIELEFATRPENGREAKTDLEWSPQLAPNTPLEVRVVDDKRAPLAQHLVRIDAEDPSRGFGPRIETDDDGRALAWSYPSGSLRLAVYRAGSDRFGTRFPLVVRSAVRPTAGEVQIVVAPGTRFALTGRLVAAGGEPFSEASLLVRRAESQSTFDFPLDTRSGRFRIEGLEPGHYELSAWCGAAGVTSLGPVQIGDTAEDGDVDLGTLRAPHPGTVQVAWHRRGSRTGLRTLLVERAREDDAWTRWRPYEDPPPIDEGPGPPRDTYALLPGKYGLEVERDGEVLVRRVFEVHSGATTRVTLE